MKWTILVSLSLVLAACGTSSDPNPDDSDEPGELIQENSVVDVAEEAGLSAFVQALEEAFGDDEFRDSGPYTLFAPTNTAFDAADTSAEDLLEYHIVEGAYILEDLESGALTTESGLDIEVSVSGNSVSLNGEANVTSPNNLEAVNGVVHAIDSVLTPPDSSDEDDPGEGEATAFFAELGPVAEGVSAEASGEAIATLDGETLSAEGSVQNLSGEITQVGLYEGGGDDVGILFYELEVDGTNFSGDFTLSREELAILADGNFYVTVSTEAYPEGEVGGPLMSED